MVRTYTQGYWTAPRAGGAGGRSGRAAFTLVEFVLSMVVMTILLAGMSSAMMLAARALPDEQAAGSGKRGAFGALEQILDELHTAQSFITKSATSAQFTVPDRNADAVSESIRYAWSGTPGQAIQRQYNAAGAVDFIENVHLFEIRYTNELMEGISRTTEVRVIVQVGPDPAGRAELATHMLNQPVAN